MISFSCLVHPFVSLNIKVTYFFKITKADSAFALSVLSLQIFMSSWTLAFSSFSNYFVLDLGLSKAYLAFYPVLSKFYLPPLSLRFVTSSFLYLNAFHYNSKVGINLN